MTTESREQAIARRPALAQKYLDEYGVSEAYVSRHGSHWLGIVAPDDLSPQPSAAVVGNSWAQVKRFLVDATQVFPARWPALVVALGSNTQYHPTTQITIDLGDPTNE